MTASTTSIDLFSALRETLGEEKTKTLIEYIDNGSKHTADEAAKSFETLLNKDIENLKLYTDSKIEASKSEIIKWTFIFWIGQIVAIAGMFKVFLHKLIIPDIP